MSEKRLRKSGGSPAEVLRRLRGWSAKPLKNKEKRKCGGSPAEVRKSFAK